jgi:hypothetical protein
MRMMSRLKAKYDTFTAVPVCGTCGEEKETFGHSWMCYPCVADGVVAAKRDEQAAQARQFSAAVLASPEYRALANRVTVLEIALGDRYLTDDSAG